MKLCLIALSFLASAQIMACSCENFPLSHDGAIEDYVAQRYDYSFKVNDQNTKWVAYYPSLLEKLEIKELDGTSCVGEGPNKVKIAHCAFSRKSDYLITVARHDCTVKVRVFSNYRSVRIKKLSTTCKE